MQAYDVRAELGGRISDEEVRADLGATGHGHRLLEFRPHLSTTDSGRTELGLTIPGPDVWTSALTAMALLRRSGYDLHALHVVSRDVDGPLPAG